jgi:predicted RNase H-like HicB family nuclease
MRKFNFTVVVEQDEDGNFLAIVPALQGCYAEGSTRDEALEFVKDAILLHLEDRKARNEPVYEEVYSGTVEVLA